MAENKVSDTVNDMVNSMVEDINSAQNGSNKVSAIKDNVGYDMSRVHSANLKILKEIDRICRKYKIQYALDAGTLIGAVRHKGFIPWDDDADIVFTRNQFEAFKKEYFCTKRKRMAEHNEFGKEGEEEAAAYLIDKGYSIRHRNWHCGKKDRDGS